MRARERGSISRRSDSAVAQRGNQNEAELHSEGLGNQKACLGSDSTCQRERNSATQRGAQYREVTGQ
jgi:hypothetical protein